MFYLKKVLIIGGPSCSGKSTVIKKLKRGELPLLRQQIGIKDPTMWRYILAKDLEKIRKPVTLQLAVHFDTWGHHTKRRSKILRKLVSISETIVVLTLCVQPSILFIRNTLRIKKAFFSFFCTKPKFKELHNLWKRQFFYKNPNNIIILYERWFKTLETYQLDHHWLLNCTEGNDRIAYRFKKERVRQFLGIER